MASSTSLVAVLAGTHSLETLRAISDAVTMLEVRGDPSHSVSVPRLRRRFSGKLLYTLPRQDGITSRHRSLIQEITVSPLRIPYANLVGSSEIALFNRPRLAFITRVTGHSAILHCFCPFSSNVLNTFGMIQTPVGTGNQGPRHCLELM
jgi:hypothetical protein